MKLYLNIEGVKKADNGDFDNALEYFSKAIEFSPKDSISYFDRASLRMHIGDVKGAMSDIKTLRTNGLKKILGWVYHIILGFSIISLFF
jgi:Flp pilus assembly protein TadD